MSAALRNYWKERETCNYCSMDRIQVRECKGFPKSIAFRILRRGPLETLFIMEYDFKIQDARYKLQAVITNENGEFIPYFWQENELFSWKPEKVKAQIYDVRKFFTTGFLMFYEKIPDGAIEQQQQGPEWDLQNERALLLELQRPESQVNCISKKLTKSDVELNSYLLLPFREVEAYLEEELKGRKSRDILQFQSVLNFDTKKKYKGLLLQCWKDGYRLAGGWRKLVKSMNLKVGQTIELYWFNVELLEICRAESSPEGDGTQENDAEGDATSSSLSI